MKALQHLAKRDEELSIFPVLIKKMDNFLRSYNWDTVDEKYLIFYSKAKNATKEYSLTVKILKLYTNNSVIAVNTLSGTTYDYGTGEGFYIHISLHSDGSDSDIIKQLRENFNDILKEKHQTSNIPIKSQEDAENFKSRFKELIAYMKAI